MARQSNRLREARQSDKVMMVLWVCFIIVGLGLCAILLWKVITFKEDEKFGPYLVPQKKAMVQIPVRGDILDCKGRILATSTMAYNVHLDCVAPNDTLWKNNVRALAKALSERFKDKSEDQYLKMLTRGRKTHNRYLCIKTGISQTDVNHVRKMPVFNRGRFKGGYLETCYEKRLYPYGSSARRTIGYVRNNVDSTAISGNKKGIEGNYDNYLHGENGIQMHSRSDFGMIPVADRINRKAVDGKSVRTTIDVDIQNIADEALRKKVEENDLIEKSCVIVLETSTGAVKAMVNLGRDNDGNLGEIDNYAVRTAEAPGSVFKGVVVMALLEDGYITTLEKDVPTYGGKWKYNKQTYDDTKHLGRHRFPGGYVKIRQAFEMSANNTFRQLVCDSDHYGNNPGRFVRKIKSLGIIDTIDFDLKGSTPPFILDPSMKKSSIKGFWDGGTFPRLAIGYGMELSPLNIVTFYNAIANNGTMMKPYLVEAILDEGKEIETFQPVIMHKNICSQATVDTLKRAMSLVATDKGGTAYWQLHGAVCPIAGKTGTAQRVFRMSNGRYGYNDGGVESQQATFVGFFPQDKPKYTAIVVIWSKPSSRNFFGASYSAPVFREIADKIYCLNEY